MGGVGRLVLRSRATAVRAAVLALLLAALAISPSLAQTPSQPPGTPSSVTVVRGDGTLDVSWPAVDGATGYNVNTSDDGKQSWSRAASGVSGTGTTLTGVTNGSTYVVAVQAVNAQGGGGWRDSASAGPYTPPSPTPTPTPTTPPATPSSVTVTRADGTLTAAWDAVSGATSYHVTYSADGGGSWHLAAFDHPSASITISATNGDTYIVGVRAKNSAGGSGWRNSAPAGPYTPPATQTPPATPSSVSITRTDGALTASWDAVAGAASYHVTYSSDGGGSWSLAAFDHPDANITIQDVANDSTYVVGVRAKNSAGGSGWRNSAPAGPYTLPTLTVSGETTDGATLTLANYGGAWYYRAQGQTGGASGQSVTCVGPVNGGQTTVNGLDPNTEYTVTAYVECGGAAIASSELFTAQNAALTHSNVGLSTATITRSGFTGAWWFKGSAPYTGCTSAGSVDSVDLTNLSSGASHTFTAHNEQYCTSSPQGSTTFTTTGEPLQLIETNATDVTVGPYASWTGPWYRKTSTSKPIDLSACMGPTTGSHEFTGLRAEVPVVLLMYSDSTCGTLVGAIALETPRPSLSVTGFNGAGATITIERWNLHWRLQQESPSLSGCTYVAEGTNSVTITGLIPGQQYTYKAYRGAGTGCDDSILGTTIIFTVPELTVDPGSTSAALTLSHWSGPWWYRAMGVYSDSSGDFIAYTGQPCRGPAQGAATAVLNGLGSGYTWGFKAYASHAACAADLSHANGNADDSRATGVLGAAPVKADTLDAATLSVDPVSGGARLTLGNWGRSDGDWWYRANVIVPHANSPKHGADGCRGPVTGGKLQHDDTNLPALTGNGAYYLFTVYPLAGCHYSAVAAYARMSSAPAINVVSVSNLSRDVKGQGGVTSDVGFGGRFVTGAADGGYWLTAVTINTSTAIGSPGGLTVAIHGDANGKPGASLTTLSGASPTGAGDHTFTCTFGCALAGNQNYYVVLTTSGASSSNAHLWNLTGSLLEDLTPAGNGWSIGDKSYRGSSGVWYEVDDPMMFKVTAEPLTATLAASNVAAWSATLTLSGHPGSWYYKANAAPHAACTGPVHAASETLSGLTASTSSYVYTAYSDSACANALATAAAFSTPDPPPDPITSVTMSRGAGTLILSWTAPADNGFSITRYDIEYKTASATDWTSGGTSTTTSKTISGVTDATAYDARVRAVNANGNAEWREASVGAR